MGIICPVRTRFTQMNSIVRSIVVIALMMTGANSANASTPSSLKQQMDLPFKGTELGIQNSGINTKCVGFWERLTSFSPSVLTNPGSPKVRRAPDSTQCINVPLELSELH